MKESFLKVFLDSKMLIISIGYVIGLVYSQIVQISSLREAIILSLGQLFLAFLFIFLLRRIKPSRVKDW